MIVTCEQAELWISIRVDGESMPEGATRDIDDHIRACERCRRLLEEEALRSARLRKALATDRAARDRLRDAIVAGLHSGPSSREAEVLRGPLVGVWRAARGARPFRRLALAAAAVLVAGVTVWLLRDGPEPPAPATSPWRIVVEETRWNMEPSHSWDGNHWVRDVEWNRRISLDPAVPASDGAPTEGPDILLDTERVKTQYVQFTGWSWH